MFNLLPRPEKNKIHKEYTLRFFTVFSFFLFFTTLLGIGLLLPSYFFSQYREVAVLNQSEAVDTKTQEYNQALYEGTLKELNTRVLFLKTNMASSTPSGVFEEIISQKNGSVHVTAFLYSAPKTGQKSILLEGKADTRDGLLLFYKNLQKEKRFTKVDLPVSDFAKNKDIKFSITLLGNF